MAYRDIPAEIARWALSKENTIYEYYTRNRGWEAWAQNELCDYLRDKYTNTAVLREQHVYEKSSKEAADLLINPGQLDHHTIIELKCESVFQDLSERGETDTIAHFARRVEEDIVKIQEGLFDKYTPARAWAVGITRAHNVSKSPEEVNWNYDVSYEVVGNTDIVVWYWHQDFPKQG